MQSSLYRDLNGDRFLTYIESTDRACLIIPHVEDIRYRSSIIWFISSQHTVLGSFKIIGLKTPPEAESTDAEDQHI